MNPATSHFELLPAERQYIRGLLKEEIEYLRKLVEHPECALVKRVRLQFLEDLDAKLRNNN